MLPGITSQGRRTPQEQPSRDDFHFHPTSSTPLPPLAARYSVYISGPRCVCSVPTIALIRPNLFGRRGVRQSPAYLPPTLSHGACRSAGARCSSVIALRGQRSVSRSDALVVRKSRCLSDTTGPKDARAGSEERVTEPKSRLPRKPAESHAITSQTRRVNGPSAHGAGVTEGMSNASVIAAF